MDTNHDDDGKSPSARIALRLKELREKQGLSLRKLAEGIGYPHSYLSRVEQGHQVPSYELAAALDEFFGTHKLFTDLVELTRDPLVADYSRTVVSREPEAVRIQVFTSSVIPGLLQTEEYARELLSAGLPTETAAEIQARVDTRMRRKLLLESEEAPLYWAIIDEAALFRPMSDTAGMRRQLEYLEQRAQAPNITVQVYSRQAALHSMQGGSLILLALQNGSTIALVESFGSGRPINDPREVAECSQLFDMLRIKALPEAESLDLIRNYMKEYDDG